MEMNGEQRLPVDQHKVWDALNDPEILKTCITGCESVEKSGDHEYQVAIVAAVGPVKAKFKGRLQLKDLDPPNSYTIAFEGQGGPAGFAKGEAQVKLSPDGGGTLMNYHAKAQVGGKIAQVGSRLIDGIAHKVADEFFGKFREVVAPAPAGEGAPAPAPAAGGGLPAWVWIVGAAVAAAVLWFAFGR